MQRVIRCNTIKKIIKMNNSNNLDAMQQFNNIAGTMDTIQAIKNRVIKPIKVQLHPNREGFESPDSYGIYRNTGGTPLGVVGSVFEPMNLELFVDSIAESILKCGCDLDVNKLSYTEYCGGSKVIFDLPYKSVKLDTPQKGDVTEYKLQFKTGFDGLTKISLGFMSFRLWCANGAGNWKQDIAINCKNTSGNQMKVTTFVNEIHKCLEGIEAHTDQLNKLVLKTITKKDVDAFLLRLTGYDLEDTKAMNGKRRAIMDRLYAAIGIETANTGMNEFSLLQGITRYTTHDLAGRSEEAMLFTNAAKMNRTAHQLLLAN